ncbi:phosphoribosylglycinamide formyltransferase [Candidatus Marinamargulisbacteria bacterium SCGC AG-439-L15]|nr:phosphoribosylglycinamide formyltransferase [Candidatus Marinamargulisbacteria bacterium SCGC AG-439-L15]
MDVKHEIKAIIYESGFTMKEVAHELGLTLTNFSNMLARRSIRYSLAKEVADVIGYDLRFRRKKS